MKKIYLLGICLFYLALLNTLKAQKTGYILLNEYMPWATNSCSTNSEFVELYNFGPGPVNIGCYIVTDAHYSITIPPNTIVNPGQYYVISGMDSIPMGCANINYVTQVDLNWNTCNCTSSPIPSTGDGWLTDGGAAVDPIVFFDADLNVVDAVVRKLPAEPSTPITSGSIAGACDSKVFNLDTMSINYETIGQSAGRGNSFAREIDGDCVWVKDPQQSGGTTNNTGGSASSLPAVLSVTNVNSCNNNGKVSVSFIGVSNYSGIFPVDYILAFDADSNNVFDLNDTYINGIDSISPTVDITGLAPGTYRLALAPKSGCNYQLFSFTILPCNIHILKPNSFAFSAKRQTHYVQLSWTAAQIEGIQKFEVERSIDGTNFEKLQSINADSKIILRQPFKYYDQQFSEAEIFYRIKIIFNNNTIAYSQVEKIAGISTKPDDISIFPNPVKNVLNVKYSSKTSQNIAIQILQTDGKMISSKRAFVHPGYNTIPIATASMRNGLYLVKIYKHDGSVVIKKLYK
ncbi:MAG: T9SS type A sorting domain-containing protein [Ginsengibacter sp.]